MPNWVKSFHRIQFCQIGDSVFREKCMLEIDKRHTSARVSYYSVLQVCATKQMRSTGQSAARSAIVAQAQCELCENLIADWSILLHPLSLNVAKTAVLQLIQLSKRNGISTMQKVAIRIVSRYKA